MSAIDTLREYAEVWRLFGSMPDDATLSAEVSALYLGVSVKHWLVIARLVMPLISNTKQKTAKQGINE
jgi:hypothetical protein